MSSKARSCPACGATVYNHNGEKDGFSLLVCRGCGTLYITPLPSEETAQDYDGYYDPARVAVPDFVDRRLDEIVTSFDPYRKNNRLLDVGCGVGSLLQAARRGGWRAEGLEVSAPAVDHVRSLGFTVFRGNLEAADYMDEHFDVVTSSEVLEHVPDPRSIIREAHRILRPGGVFWATTPHGRGISARVLNRDWSIVCPPEHLQLFSIGGMKTLLDAAGFRRTQVVAQSLNPHELLQGLRARTAKTDSNVRPALSAAERNESGYALNKALTQSSTRRRIKSALNNLLIAGRLGDSLKIRAVK